ncbi:MAG: HD domain-containing protein [Candidatus Omnitrophica bacterium]|nr:HD domain-containing protein [Candidatus Omnitrophota bacterium]
MKNHAFAAQKLRLSRRGLSGRQPVFRPQNQSCSPSGPHLRFNPALSTFEKSLLDEAQTLGSKHHYEKQHAHQVARLALLLFDQLKPLHKLELRERVYLAAAALLHDVGLPSAEKAHHKASFKIIHGFNFFSLSRRERLLVALIARYHRKALPKISHPYFSALSKADKKTVERLSAILRIADGLDRSHLNLAVKISCRLTPRYAYLKLGCRQRCPDEKLAALAKGDLFEKIFKRKLIIK